MIQSKNYTLNEQRMRKLVQFTFLLKLTDNLWMINIQLMQDSLVSRPLWRALVTQLWILDFVLTVSILDVWNYFRSSCVGESEGVHFVKSDITSRLISSIGWWKSLLNTHIVCIINHFNSHYKLAEKSITNITQYKSVTYIWKI